MATIDDRIAALHASLSAGQPNPLVSALLNCVSFLVVDRKGVIVMASPPCEQTFGYFSGSMRGKNIRDLMPERFRQDHGAHFESFWENPTTKTMGFQNIRPIGLTSRGVEIELEIGLQPVMVDDSPVVFATILRSRVTE